MSEENVENYRHVLAAFHRRDLDASLVFMDPELEFTSRVIPVAGDVHYRGHDGIREWWKDLLTVFPDFQVEAIEIRDLGEWTVLAARVSGHGADSGAPFEQRIWQAVQWRDGKVVSRATFDTEAKPSKPPGCRISSDYRFGRAGVALSAAVAAGNRARQERAQVAGISPSWPSSST